LGDDRPLRAQGPFLNFPSVFLFSQATPSPSPGLDPPPLACDLPDGVKFGSEFIFFFFFKWRFGSFGGFWFFFIACWGGVCVLVEHEGFSATCFVGVGYCGAFFGGFQPTWEAPQRVSQPIPAPFSIVLFTLEFPAPLRRFVSSEYLPAKYSLIFFGQPPRS